MLSYNNFYKWFYFILLVILFGSAFLLIEISLKSFSPSIIAFTRVFLAAVILLFYSLIKKYSFDFIRDIFIAAFLGAGIFSDIFFIAFKLPNLFRRITAEGALTSAVVPIYLKLKEQKISCV